jgi:prepilin-type N-terminal cleavage/methylation domain-containing protein
MLTRIRRAGSDGQDTERDAGVTLIELIIAMGIFAILMGIFMVGIARMTHQTVRVQSVGEATVSLQRAFERLDRQIRYAEAVNRSVLVNGSYYLEFQTSAESLHTAVGRCDQYRVNVAAGTFEARSWNLAAPYTASGWASFATRVVVRKNSAGVVIVPFQVLPTSSDFIRQRVTVRLDVKRPDAPVVQTDGTFVARNTTTNTATNADTNTDGVSDTQVCQENGRP